ncbi:MAG: peptidoglycan-binding protein [Sandaracinaceae bacterium]|nr:peptidoglycan-binding protein [Sandaracinaceae bacterium]
MTSANATQPLGTGSYVVRAGEGLSEIADRHGLFWETIWLHPANEALRLARVRPEVLMPGDRLTIPPTRARSETRATGGRHVFRRRGVPAKIVLNVLDFDGEPLVGKAYELVIGDRTHEGVTGAGGRVEHWIATGARSALLTVWPAEAHMPSTLRYALAVGSLDPVETLRGLRDRLRNLGYLCPRGEGPLDAETQAAIRKFQTEHALDSSGEPDDATRARLVEVHGS